MPVAMLFVLAPCENTEIRAIPEFLTDRLQRPGEWCIKHTSLRT
jgi:hypothetical protein